MKARTGRSGVAGSSTGPVAVRTCRPLQPYVELVADDSEQTLLDFAVRYLQKQTDFKFERFTSPLLALHFLSAGDKALSAGNDPRGSFWIERRPDPNQAPLDRTFVVVACLAERNSPRGAPFVAFGLGGLRVPIHVAAAKEGKLEARIVSSVSNLPNFATKSGRALVANLIEPAVDDLLANDTKRFPDGHSFINLALHLVRRDSVPALEASVDQPASPSDPTARRYYYAWRPIPGGNGSGQWVPVRSVAIRTGVTAAPVEIVRIDPATRLGNALAPRPQDVFRTGGAFENVPAPTPDPILVVPDPVYLSRPREGLVRADAAAVIGKHSAEWHAQDLLDRIAAYGLPLAEVLKFAPGLLEVMTFVPVAHNTDGRTINAEVKAQALLPLASVFGPVAANATAIYLQMRFALAELHSEPDVALGLACDPRWVWHEFAHVLIYGATGELEFAFAHSVGDALGAILFDPDSALRDDPLWSGASFPWVRLDRRHDREPDLGWSWTGTMFRYPPNAAPLHSHQIGYWAEQIMSTTLFHLYRCLGGDLPADALTRRVASDQTLYLVMDAILLLGAAVSTTSPGVLDFVGALMTADAFTSQLLLPVAQPQVPRLGGAAVKPTRWCFERQGLYPDVAKPWPHDTAGEPPDVDVYVGDGDYEPSRRPIPAAFVWSPDTSGGWRLSVEIRVRNRGKQAANHVDVHAWLAFGPDGTEFVWDPLAWKNSTATWHPYLLIESGLSVPGRGSKKVNGMFVGISAAEKAQCKLLVAVTCADDPTIIDPDDPTSINPLTSGTGLPCSKHAGPLSPLLRGDNNLALYNVAP